MSQQRNKEIVKSFDEKHSIIFPLISALLKTGRNWQNCHSENFADLLFMPIEAFDELIFNFPIEMHMLKHKKMNFVNKYKLFNNKELFQMISVHSSRSISKYYEKEYDPVTIWIPIPIPISQRKISRNYVDNFIKKVRYQWREILLPGDLNLCLNSYSIMPLLKNDFNNDDEMKISNLSSDPIENMKNITRVIEIMTKRACDRYNVKY
jgi:hypothetical protein